MVLFRQIPFYLPIAVIAEAIRVPSLHGDAHRYFKLVTFSNFWLFMQIYVLMLFVLLVMILLFSVPTSAPYAVALSTSLVGEVLIQCNMI